MVWEVTFTCDICGQKKGDGNHWWMIALPEEEAFNATGNMERFTLQPWHAEESHSSHYSHLCGQNCALQALERFMNSGSLQIEVPAGLS